MAGKGKKKTLRNGWERKKKNEKHDQISFNV